MFSDSCAFLYKENPRFDRGFIDLIGMSLQRKKKPSCDKITLRSVNCNASIKGGLSMTKSHDVHSLSHTKWNCKYHIVFAPKYRRKVFYGQKRYEIGQILRELCRWKEVNLLEAEACPDHIHMLVEVPPKLSLSNFMGFLKGKSSLMIYEKWGNMKYKYRNRQFWCRGYYVDTVGKNEKKIATYIQEQLKEDEMSEQLTLDLTDPFTGNRK